jgi:hypothetical protein
MKLAVLCLLVLSACSDLTVARNYRTYALTWTCVSPEACERTAQVTLIDRAEIINAGNFVDFSSTLDEFFQEDGQMVASDMLPAGCYWLHGLALFASELEPSRFCRTSGKLELELSIPNQDPATHSKWLVEGREIDP